MSTSSSSLAAFSLQVWQVWPLSGQFLSLTSLWLWEMFAISNSNKEVGLISPLHLHLSAPGYYLPRITPKASCLQLGWLLLCLRDFRPYLWLILFVVEKGVSNSRSTTLRRKMLTNFPHMPGVSSVAKLALLSFPAVSRKMASLWKSDGSEQMEIIQFSLHYAFIFSF